MLILRIRPSPLDQFQLNPRPPSQRMQTIKAFPEKAFDPPVHDPHAAANQKNFDRRSLVWHASAILPQIRRLTTLRW
jgi:hypothetical protein